MQPQPVRGRLRRKYAAEDVRGARHGRRGRGFPGADAHDAVLEPGAGGVIDVRELSLGIRGRRAVRLPRRHPVLAVLDEKREPLVPAPLVEIPRLAVDELNARGERASLRAGAHGYAFVPTTPAWIMRAHSR